MVLGMDHLEAPKEQPSGGASAAEGGCEVEVLLIRHAESRNNALRREVIAMLGPDASAADIMRELDKRRSEDAELSERGTQQAQALASVLSSRLRGRAVWCVSSPMVRALRTIEPTAQALGITQDRWWVQCGSYEVGGCYLGDKAFPAQSHAHITQAFPVRCVEMASGEDEGWYSHKSGKETRQEAEERCEKWVQWLLTTLPSIGTQGGHRPVVALVGHGEFMHLCLSKLVGGGLRCGHGYVHGNTGISTLHFKAPPTGPPLLMIESINDMAHLPQALRSGGSLNEDGWWHVVTHTPAPTQWQTRRVGPGEASLVTACQVLCTANGGPSHVPGGAWRAVCVRGDSSVVLGAVLYVRETGVLHHVAVLEGYRARHIGSVLVQSVVEEMRGEGGHTSLTAPLPTDEAARAFFRRLGWGWEEGEKVMHLFG